MQFLNCRVELVKGSAQGPGQMVVLRQQRIPLGPQDAQIELAVEERDFEAVGGGGIAMRLWDAMDVGGSQRGGRLRHRFHHRGD